jgi:hypothetical protein
LNNLTIGTGITDHTNLDCLFTPDPTNITGCTFNNPNGGYVDIDVVEGINPATATKITFNNRVEPARLLKICSIAGTGVPIGTQFTFDFYINDETASESNRLRFRQAARWKAAIALSHKDNPRRLPTDSARSRQLAHYRSSKNSERICAVRRQFGDRNNFQPDLPLRKATIPIADGINELTFTNISTAPISAPTATGTNVVVAPTTNLNLNFGSVSTAGDTTVSVVPLDQQQPLPSSFALSGNSLVYQITTSAVFSGNLTVSFKVPDVATASACS